MTSINSAAASGSPSNRRSFFTTLVAASLLSGSALASSIPPSSDDPHPDADLFELEASLMTADMLLNELGDRCDEVIEAEPPVPDALIWRRSDWIIIDPRHLEQVCCSDGKFRRTYATEGVVEVLRNEIAEWKALPRRTRLLCGGDRKITRAEEIIAGIEAWKVDCRAAEAASGYTTAAEARDAQQGVVNGLLQRIAKTPAHTAEGVAVHIRAALVAARGNLKTEKDQFAKLLAKQDLRPQEAERLLVLAAMISAARLGAGSAMVS